MLVGVGWGGRRELVEGDDKGEDDKNGDEGLHLEAALGQGGSDGSSSVFPHRCSCFAFGFCAFKFLDFSFETIDFRIS